MTVGLIDYCEYVKDVRSTKYPKYQNNKMISLAMEMDLMEKEQQWCPAILTTSFVAERCGVSTVTVLNWITEKKLTAFRLPKGHYRIYREDFIDFLNNNHMNISK
jgi:excisionase family DNA binding protein